ncbi:hypothetical protein HL658_10870 [Azospirillum sp. RWY-5-1]|uniref:Uncharacterized protein n=1 Tax=Azospirillum oleiclasticum TaxID=2735135 RepID=A0ABX2TAI4_9PROT|nr:hypothetical protein [Azospirillum oleiclasticum]NYZ13056.1 hypothetical protein [Azospirillum oleiclasticum]NYZ20271.1 hypothetical protein [Azospirillum oleiclasticum]
MDPDKLAKVLAMAESDHQGEALSALRAARIMLSRAGMTFKDLAAGARPVPPPSPSPSPAEAAKPEPPAPSPPPDHVVQGLRRHVTELEKEVASLRRQLDRASGEADRQKDEADRWRTLARETADKLWDLGRALERRHTSHASADRRRAILDHLQDPHSALLSDHEIARRVGAPAPLVAHWRRRLAIVGRKLRLLPVQPRGRGLWGAFKRRPAPQDEPRRRWLGQAQTTIAGRAGYEPGAGRAGYGTRR